MPDAKLKFNDQEITIGEGAVTFGRASDNSVAFPEDSNVSRYHAEIEKRGDEFWLTDLGSSNGTTVNGAAVGGESVLKDGDSIAFGGTSVVEIEFIEETTKNNDASPTPDASAESEKATEVVPDAQATKKHPAVLLVAGGVCGLAVICVFAAGLIYYTRSGSTCEAKAIISSPESGETIDKVTEIEVETENAECVSRAIFLIGGEEFARSTEKPFTATLDPKQFPKLANGDLHSLQIVLEDKNGGKIVQPNQVALAFETREIEKKPTPTPEILQTETAPTPTKNTGGKQVSLIDVQEMSARLVKQFGGNFPYKVSNPQFLGEVQKKTQEYAQEGYFERATAFRDAINVAYVQEKNLDAPLGFILAMSRSKFALGKQGNNEGLWQMTNEFVTVNSYNKQCGAETLSDKSQICAAKASSLYLQDIVQKVFEGDVIYSVAAFGKTQQDAIVWKAGLSADRSDFWNAIKNPQEREQIVRFFAAGIVVENPQQFGLKKDKRLSELYPSR